MGVFPGCVNGKVAPQKTSRSGVISTETALSTRRNLNSPMPPRIIYELPSASQDLTGKRFGRWTVIKFSYRKLFGKDTGHNFWKCRCSCERNLERVVNGPSLLSSSTLSCGCYARERIIATNTKHGFACFGNKHPLLTTHRNMMNRCYNKNCSSYKDYGEKGIQVEKPWHDCATFIREMEVTWNGGYNDNGERLSLDRISSSSNYGPGLCKWSSAIEQANNQSSNVKITALGKTQNVAQWSREMNLCPSVIARRKKLGWTDKESVTIPPGGKRPSTNRAADGERQAMLKSKLPGESFVVGKRGEAASLATIGRNIGIPIRIKRERDGFPEYRVTLLIS